jgi:V4R domain
MEPTPGAYREIAVPVSLFATLRHELAKGAGALPTIHALQAAGYAAGADAAGAFAGSGGEDVGAIPEDVFWTRLASFFSARGWGSLSAAGSSDAVGVLSSGDWVEANGAAGAEASCSFTSGFLSGFLSRIAGGRVAVLEVSCRGRGDERCSFAFGSEAAIHELYGHLLQGVALDRALGSL